MQKLLAIVAAAAFLGGCAAPGTPGASRIAMDADRAGTTASAPMTDAEWIRAHYGTRA